MKKGHRACVWPKQRQQADVSFPCWIVEFWLFRAESHAKRGDETREEDASVRECAHRKRKILGAESVETRGPAAAGPDSKGETALEPRTNGAHVSVRFRRSVTFIPCCALLH
jgi:hypothetical protein